MGKADPTKARLLSIDAFRGFTIASMILVNNPGSWAHRYAPLRHAEWHGCTFTDLIFPFFLFLVGISIPLSLDKRIQHGLGASKIWPRILRRGALLFLFGLVLAGFPSYELSTIRIPGVLQRIAVCYVLASLLYLHAPRRVIPYVLLASLVVYQALLTWVPPPSGIAGNWDSKDGNLAAYIDRLFLDGHLWRSARTWDPEGILSTLPAVGTVLLGILGSRLLPRGPGARTRIIPMLALGFTLLLTGLFWDRCFPINKALWTSSYVAFTGGCAFLFLAAFWLLVEGLQWRRFGTVFSIYGVNAILVFVGSGLLGRALVRFSVEGEGGQAVSWKSVLYSRVQGLGLSPENSSLLYAVLWILSWFVILYVLWRKRIVLKL